MSDTRSSRHRLDPHAPLVLDTRELGRRPGSMRRVELSVPAPAGLGVEMVAVPEGSDVVLRLRLESVLEGVLVSGTARVRLAGECGRCLDPLDSSVEVDVQQLYAYPESDADDDDEVERLEGDLLDLEPALRDAVVLTLPLSPVCREDCPGLCATCGERLADDPDHTHADVDPRWAALRHLHDRPTEET